MEGPEGAAPCSSIAIDSILRFGTAGAIWGLCSGPYGARKLGLTSIPRASFVAKSVGQSSLQCGLVAGIITSTRCGMQKYRRRDDWVNSCIGGAVAGAVVGAGTGRWTQVIGMACLVSVFSAAADIARTN